jgi:hypothetical protein
LSALPLSRRWRCGRWPGAAVGELEGLEGAVPAPRPRPASCSSICPALLEVLLLEAGLGLGECRAWAGCPCGVLLQAGGPRAGEHGDAPGRGGGRGAR